MAEAEPSAGAPCVRVKDSFDESMLVDDENDTSEVSIVSDETKKEYLDVDDFLLSEGSIRVAETQSVAVFSQLSSPLPQFTEEEEDCRSESPVSKAGDSRVQSDVGAVDVGDKVQLDETTTGIVAFVRDDFVAIRVEGSGDLFLANSTRIVHKLSAAPYGIGDRVLLNDGRKAKIVWKSEVVVSGDAVDGSDHGKAKVLKDSEDAVYGIRFAKASRKTEDLQTDGDDTLAALRSASGVKEKQFECHPHCDGYVQLKDIECLVDDDWDYSHEPYHVGDDGVTLNVSDTSHVSLTTTPELWKDGDSESVSHPLIPAVADSMAPAEDYYSHSESEVASGYQLDEQKTDRFSVESFLFETERRFFHCSLQTALSPKQFEESFNHIHNFISHLAAAKHSACDFAVECDDLVVDLETARKRLVALESVVCPVITELGADIHTDTDTAAVSTQTEEFKEHIASDSVEPPTFLRMETSMTLPIGAGKRDCEDELSTSKSMALLSSKSIVDYVVTDDSESLCSSGPLDDDNVEKKLGIAMRFIRSFLKQRVDGSFSALEREWLRECDRAHVYCSSSSHRSDSLSLVYARQSSMDFLSTALSEETAYAQLLTLSPIELVHALMRSRCEFRTQRINLMVEKLSDAEYVANIIGIIPETWLQKQFNDCVQTLRAQHKIIQMLNQLVFKAEAAKTRGDAIIEAMEETEAKGDDHVECVVSAVRSTEVATVTSVIEAKLRPMTRLLEESMTDGEATHKALATAKQSVASEEIGSMQVAFAKEMEGILRVALSEWQPPTAAAEDSEELVKAVAELKEALGGRLEQALEQRMNRFIAAEQLMGERREPAPMPLAVPSSAQCKEATARELGLRKTVDALQSDIRTLESALREAASLYKAKVEEMEATKVATICSLSEQLEEARKLGRRKE